MSPRAPPSCDARCIAPFGEHAMIDDATIESAIRRAHEGHRASSPRPDDVAPRVGASSRVRTWLRTTAVVVSALLGLATGPAVLAQASADSVGLDRAITADVKKRFEGNRDVDAATIRVETLDGVVVLYGYASSDAARTEAAVTAWRAEGVKRVRNEIHVRP